MRSGRSRRRADGIFQYAELVPSVDLTKLEEVLVITESPAPSAEEKVRRPKKSPGGGPEGKMKRILLFVLLGNGRPHPSDDPSEILSHPENPAGFHADLHPLPRVFVSTGPRGHPGLLPGLFR